MDGKAQEWLAEQKECDIGVAWGCKVNELEATKTKYYFLFLSPLHRLPSIRAFRIALSVYQFFFPPSCPGLYCKASVITKQMHSISFLQCYWKPSLFCPVCNLQPQCAVIRRKANSGGHIDCHPTQRQTCLRQYTNSSEENRS